MQQRPWPIPLTVTEKQWLADDLTETHFSFLASESRMWHT